MKSLTCSKKTLSPSRVLLFILVMGWAGMATGQTGKPDEVSNDSTLLFREEVHMLHSEITGEEYMITISLPAVYYTRDTVFPVLFSTDAERTFDIISGVVNGLSFPGNTIPYMVVVGIGYPIRGLEEWGARRHNDMTVTYDSARSEGWKRMLVSLSGRSDLEVRSGGAERFLMFIEKELIPFVENTYRVDPHNRGIAGYSLGGFFSIYAMLQSPGTFQNYFAGSPSFWSDEGIIFELEEEYAKNHNHLDAKLYMSVGELENASTVGDMKKMESVLRSRRYPGLVMVTKIFPDEMHQTCYPAALTRGLMFMYGK